MLSGTICIPNSSVAPELMTSALIAHTILSTRLVLTALILLTWPTTITSAEIATYVGDLFDI